jgi:hypothetical protein
MHRYSSQVAYGSECSAWQDFVADCYKVLGFAPWDDAHWGDAVEIGFANYWLCVARGESTDYDPDTGAKLD